MLETAYPKPPEFVAQGDRVLVVGLATGRIKATNKPFKDDWVFDITVRNGKLTKIREYIDTQALARASEMDASGWLSATHLRPSSRVDGGSAMDRRPARRVFVECPAITEIPMYNQFKLSELIRFARVDAGSIVIDVYPGDGDWTRLFSDIVGPQGRVYSFVPAEIASVKNDSVDRMRTLAKEPAERTSKPSQRTSWRCRRPPNQPMSFGCTCSTTICTPR